jgi:Fe/S biogenesis protein NfuA
MAIHDSAIISVHEKALAMLLGVRDRESDAADLGLVVGITGVDRDTFTYQMAFMRIEDAAEDDQVSTDGALPIIVPAGDVDLLRGATLRMSKDLLRPGLTIDNPNSPSPTINAASLAGDLTGTVAENVVAVVDQAINPAIAAHGGFVEVVAVEDQTAYVRLGGGCQGCGMAPVTLSQGIESTITQMVPEIAKVVDVTDHAEGSNPYFEQAKK